MSKTTVGGICTAIGLFLAAFGQNLGVQLPGEVANAITLFGHILAGAAAAWLGWSAQDDGPKPPIIGR